MSDKQLPSKRDYREAKAFLQELFDVDGPQEPIEITPSAIADRFLEQASSCKIQRYSDRLKLEFDLSDEGDQLPEASNEEREYVRGQRVLADEPDGGTPGNNDGASLNGPN